MTKLLNSFLNPKLEARQRAVNGGFGVFAREPVSKGELLMVWGGHIVNPEELETLPERIQWLTIQVEENLFLAPFDPPEQADFVNHSCDPNAGLSGQISLAARRDILPDEEICFDYAMSDGTPYDEFDCQCGAPNCRGRVTGEDWRNPVLWERYAGCFSPYLQRRIDALKKSLSPTEETGTQPE